MNEDSNSYDDNYILQKQLGQELYSPEYTAYQDSLAEFAKENEQQFVSDLVKRGVSQEDATAEIGGLQEPAVDPVSAAAGGFGAVFKSSLAQGLKLLPSLGKAAASAGAAGVAEYPIGLSTGKVGEKYPKLAMPVSVVLGVLSGVTFERIIEKSVAAGFKGAGKKITTALIKKESAKISKKIQRGVFDETTGDAVTALNKEINNLPVEKALGSGAPIPKTKITESKFLKLESDIADKKYASNINLERINSADDIKQQIDKTATLFAPETKRARRSYRTNKQTERAAEMLGMTPKQLLKRRKGVAFNAEEALAARRILVSSADNLARLAEKVQSLDATDLDKFNFRKALNTHYAIQAQVSGMTAEAGRALQSFNIKAASSKLKIAQIKDLMQNMPGGSVEDLAKAISSIDTLDGINVFVRQAQRATSVDMFLEAWINGLLSGPQTHAVNTTSNSLVAIWQIPERILASGISKTFGDKAVGSGEALAQTFGLIQGAKDGFKAFLKSAWKTARLQPIESVDELGKIEARKYSAIGAANIREFPLIKKIAPNALDEGGVGARFADYLGEAIRTPGKLLMAEDDFFKSIGYRMELNARAYRRAVLEEGLKGKSASTRIQEIINNPQELAPDIHLAAIDAARYQTFTKPLGEGGRALQTFLNNHPMGRVIAPFIRTPTNILKFAGERTPLAWVSKSVRNEIMAGGARRDLALAKMSIGGMVMGIVAAMAMDGRITGNGPSNTDMRRIKYDTGWKPYSVKVGDKYYSYNRLEPIGMLFGIAADFTEIAGSLNDTERDELASAIVASVSQNITSKTWLRGVSEAISALEDPQGYGSRWFENLAGTAIPAGVAQTERIMSPEMSAVYSAMDSIKSRIPGYSDTLPPRRNLWGEPIVLEGGLGPDIVSPIYTSTAKKVPIDEELLNLKLPLKMPNQTQSIDGVMIKLEPKEYDRLLVLMNTKPLASTGKVLKQSLNDLVTRDENYKNSPNPEIKEMRIRALLTEARIMAKEQLKIEFPVLQEIIAAERIGTTAPGPQNYR